MLLTSIIEINIAIDIIATIPKFDTDIFSASLNPFISYFVIKSVIILLAIALPNITNIDSCLLVINIRSAKPANINKSFNLIFISVNISIATSTANTTSISLFSINVNGKCSLILCVVFPIIVL